jgi:protein phosphatase
MAVIPLTQTGPEDGGNFEAQWEGDFLQAHVLTDIGVKRKRNEDSCGLCVPQDKALAGARGLFFAVADGMGGVNGGAFASRLALQTMIQEYFSMAEGTAPERLGAAVEMANRRIYEEAENNPDYKGMGTTVSAVLILDEHIYVAQVGDSRVYLKRNGQKLWQITHDHSLVAEQVRSGIISEEEARTHALKNLITRAVGTKDYVKVDLFTTQIKEGDTLMICSDGLCGVVEDMEIGECLARSNPQGAARKLVGLAIEGGGPDNISAVVVRVTQVPPKGEKQPGAEEVSPSANGFMAMLRRIFGK